MLLLVIISSGESGRLCRIITSVVLCDMQLFSWAPKCYCSKITTSKANIRTKHRLQYSQMSPFFFTLVAEWLMSPSLCEQRHLPRELVTGDGGGSISWAAYCALWSPWLGVIRNLSLKVSPQHHIVIHYETKKAVRYLELIYWSWKASITY